MDFQYYTLLNSEMLIIDKGIFDVVSNKVLIIVHSRIHDLSGCDSK
jgi:hypothetical protein